MRIILGIFSYFILIGLWSGCRTENVSSKEVLHKKSQALVQPIAASKQKPKATKIKRRKLSSREVKILAARKKVQLLREQEAKKRNRKLQVFHSSLRQQNAAIQRQWRVYKSRKKSEK